MCNYSDKSVCVPTGHHEDATLNLSKEFGRLDTTSGNDNNSISAFSRMPYSRASFAASSSSKIGPRFVPGRTSLVDFKKLLQATQMNKRNSISAMEALKPKVNLETTL